MKQYILFTREELEDMLNGKEVTLSPSAVSGKTIYFMSKEHFAELADARPEEE